MRKKWWVVIVFSILMLACNMPGIGSESVPTPTPEVYVTVIVATPTPQSTASKEATVTPALPMPTATASLTTTEALTTTSTISGTVTPTATATLTPTATPDGPTPTPTLAEPGPPLGFDDPAWELLEWHEVPDENNWEGTIKIYVVGGVPPYRYQIEDNPISDSDEVVVRWRICKPMPGTIRVWSADGQEAHTSIWIWELGCKD